MLLGATARSVVLESTDLPAKIIFPTIKWLFRQMCSFSLKKEICKKIEGINFVRKDDTFTVWYNCLDLDFFCLWIVVRDG